MLPDLVEFGPRGFRRGGEVWVPEMPFYAVIGDPVAHSLSPRLQNAGLDEREIATEYVALQIGSDQLTRLKRETRDGMLAGFNATAPHKEAVAALCEGRTDQARALGAVNTIKVEEGRWLGHNTDSGGIVSVLCQAWTETSPPAVAYVLGAGGSARAAVERIVVRNRSEAGRKRFAAWVKGCPYADTVRVEILDQDRPPAPDEPAVWISCLAGGVAIGDFLPDAAGSHAALLLDLRYGNQLPEESPPLGFQRVDGLPVLLMQGGLSFAWWFGPPVPWTAFQAALAFGD